jgi:two-component system CheB/CheR fusion protein
MKVIGIGASAGGLEALSDLFSTLPNELSNQASFIIAQHLSPHHNSLLVQILSRDISIPILEITNGLEIRERHIYIIPPDSELRVEGSKLFLEKSSREILPKPSIDRFFISLAKEYKENAIAIILSGTGTDGSKGILEIKANKGIIFVQDPKTAKYDGMPISSIQTGLVDYILPSKEILLKIFQLVSIDNHTNYKTSKFREIFFILEKKIGIDFSNYKINTIERRIQRRIQFYNLTSLKEYIQILKTKETEILELYHSLLIHVSSYFRDKEAFSSLEKVIEEKLLNFNQPNFRVWVIGCANGQEVISLLILIEELFKKINLKNINLQIFATDIDQNSLTIARKSFISNSDSIHLSKEYLDFYFNKVTDGFELAKNYRSKILFSKHDITSNPPFLNMDIISCRNLLIYFNSEIQKKIFHLFNYSLKENGILFLGRSEKNNNENLFETISERSKIYKKINYTNKFLFQSNRTSLSKYQTNIDIKKEYSKLVSFKDKLIDKIQSLNSTSYILINKNSDIIESRGDLSEYIKFPDGELSLNLNKFLKEDYQIEIRHLINKVIKSKEEHSIQLERIDSSGKLNTIVISISLLQKEEEIYLILFQSKINLQIIEPSSQTLSSNAEKRILELERELKLAREQLQLYTDEVENSHQELQALNEEMQSTNEELQSSNEELETSNEELQASNEELLTAYSEIKNINADLINKEFDMISVNQLYGKLFENTQEGNILLNEDFQIELINDTAKSIFQSLSEEPILIFKNLIDAIPDSILTKVVSSLKKIQNTQKNFTEYIEFLNKDSIRYFQISFYPILVEGRVNQFIIGIHDLTEMKRKEIELHKKDEYLSSLLESNSSFLIRTDIEGKYTYVNNAFCVKFGLSEIELIGKYYGPTVHPDDHIICEKAVQDLFLNPSLPVTFEMRKPNPLGGFFHTEWEFVLIQNNNGEAIEVQGIGRDITEHKKTYNQLVIEKDKLEMIIWGGSLGTWEWDIPNDVIQFNHIWARMLGFEEEKDITLNFTQWLDLVYVEDRNFVESNIKDVLEDKKNFYEFEHRKVKKNGEIVWILATGKVIQRDSKGKPIVLTGIHQDITEKKKNELALILSEQTNSSILSSMEEGIVLQDLTGKIISCNLASEKILGLSYDQMIGRTSLDPRWRAIKLNGENYPGEEHPVMLTIKTGIPQKNSIMGVHKLFQFR